MSDDGPADDGPADEDTTAPTGTPTLLVAGTASHVGKSTVAAGLCRLLADRGLSVEPFKAQNMSTNARAVPKAVGADDGREADAGFGEIGVSQYVQARAARTDPTTDHNPVLLKPRGDAESQLVLDGEAVAHYGATEYYEQYWNRARQRAIAAHRRLAEGADVVVAEGAGSIAEINLHDHDLANVETARFADASVLLVVDIERGGAFASVVGTLDLVPEDVRERIEGVLITKFRGDETLLDPGIEAVEERTGVPVVGVVPYEDPGLPEEDSVALPGPNERLRRGEDGVPEERTVTIAVPRLPRISNFTDFGPLAAMAGVEVSYRPPGGSYQDADAVVLPGTKNTVDDLLALREADFGWQLDRFDGPIVGLCGGYQLLGERITGADVEGTGEQTVVEGFGLLPVETAFSTDKRVLPTTHWCTGTPVLDGFEGAVDGYEIHMGSTRATGAVATPFARTDGGEGTAALAAGTGRVLGTYLHGLFESPAVRDGFVAAVRSAAGVTPLDDQTGHRSPYDRAAALVERSVDRSWLEGVLDRGSGTDGGDDSGG